MSQEIQELIIQVGQRGMADVERTFQGLDTSLGKSLRTLSHFNKALVDEPKKAEAQLRQVGTALSDMEAKVSHVEKGLKTTFSGRQISGFSQNLRTMRKDLEGAQDAMSQAAARGDKAAMQSAKKRVQAVQMMVNKEVSSFSKMYQKHREEFSELAQMQKNTLGQNAMGAAQGGSSLLRQIAQRDVGGAASTLGRGGQALFKGAQKRAFDSQLAGNAGGAASAKALGQLAKVAGPLAIVAGIVATLVKSFIDLDSQIKDINKSMLQNVPITSLAADMYTNMNDRIADGEMALRDFRNTVMTDADLRMLGLTPEMMGGMMDAFEQQSGQISALRSEGIGYKNALEAAQVAALNLGVDANSTMDLLGQLADVTGASFTEALDSLSLIVSSAQDAGVSTKRFFNIVQGVVGEMGMYNFRLEETAVLFGKLSTIMDSKSAEKYIQDLSQAFKNQSAAERMKSGILMGSGARNAAGQRAVDSAASQVDMGALASQMAALGLTGFNKDSLSKTMGGLSQKERDALISSTLDSNQGQGERLRKFENLRQNALSGNLMKQQGVMSDFTQIDKLLIPLQNLEDRFGGNIQNVNSVQSEAFGVNEEQLRVLKAIAQEGRGDFARLEMQLQQGGTSRDVTDAAKAMGYEISVQNGKLLGKDGKEVSGFQDLLRSMDERKSEGLVESQKTAAEKTADLQRTLLDTIKYQLMDLVQGIYRTILDIYDTILNFPGAGGKQNDKDRSKILKEEFGLRDQLRGNSQNIDRARAAGDSGKVQKLEAERATLKSQLEKTKEMRGLLNSDSGMSIDAANALTSGTTVGEGLRFEYSGGMGRNFTERNYQGMKMGDSTLQKIVTGDGKIIEGSEAISAFVKASQQTQEQASGIVGQVIAKELAENGELFPEDAKKLAEKTNAILADQGIKIQDKTVQKMVDAQLEAQIDMQVIKDLMKFANRSQGGAQMLLRKYREGDPEALNMVNSDATVQGIMGNYGVSPVNMQKGRDARMVTGGLPLLDLKPGDIIVDQNALANTLVGGTGQFVPDLMRQVAGKAGTVAGGGAQNNLTAHFHINGGNPQEIRTEITRVLEQWQRSTS
jgi:hypothetical protein